MQTEIIVVDTGSADRTREIAAQFTDHVFDYKWHQDFAAARNFACSKASMDYWMWLDADDVIRPDQQKLLLRLKESLNPATDIVMMKYLTGFDQNGHVTFSYYRERLIKNRRGFLWEGRVHEAVTPRGNILYSPVEIEHRKLAAGDSDRNLRIYETMIGEGETLCPRHQFYYGRELYYHQRYEEAVKVFEHFLEEPDGWVENRIDACLAAVPLPGTAGAEAGGVPGSDGQFSLRRAQGGNSLRDRPPADWGTRLQDRRLLVPAGPGAHAPGNLRRICAAGLLRVYPVYAAVRVLRPPGRPQKGPRISPSGQGIEAGGGGR